MKSLQFFILLCAVIKLVTAAGKVGRASILVGAIFHGDDEQSEIAFNAAIVRANRDLIQIELVPRIEHISRTDSFTAQQIVCQWASEGIQGIFGPSSVETSGIVSSIADKFDIPHIIYHWNTKPLWSFKASQDHKMTLNFYPDSDVLAAALQGVLKDYEWKSYTIVYDNKDNLIKLKKILEFHDSNSKPIAVRRLGDDYAGLLKEIHFRGDANVIVDIDAEKIVPFLKAADEVKMLDDYKSYLITNLDTHTLDYSPLGEVASNITTLRLVDPNSDEMINALRKWNIKINNFNERQVTVEAALVNDAVMMFAKAFERYMIENVGGNEEKLTEIENKKHDCKDPNVVVETAYARNFFDYLKLQTYNGSTGEIKFNSASGDFNRGKRVEFTVEILERTKEGFDKIGKWDPINEVKYDRESASPDQQIQEKIQDKRFRVVVKEGIPFLMVKKEDPDGPLLEGNARFEGYVMDLIHKISLELNFKYDISLIPDNSYGNRDKTTGKWNGIVKYLMDGKADLGICDLTITYERKTAVDFTSPFMSLGISILHYKPEKKAKSLFSFLDPFNKQVWIYTGLAYIFLSLVVFFLSRINNDDWESSHPCDQDPEEVESIWNVINCIWLAMGSIMGQGCDILPKGSSTRICTGLWWFFALIMLASYTANLAAFLTNERSTNSISSAEDLAKQTKIKYGAVKGGSTMRFFQESNFSTYQRMWAVMEETDGVHTENNQGGVDRVMKEKGNYAFMMESIPMEYQTNRKCELQQVGGLLDSKGYGIALPMNSPYRKAFSEAILKLSEKGVLNDIKDKWWKSEHSAECATDGATDGELGIAEVGGVFLVLGFGCLFALFVAIIEFLINVEKIAVEEKIPPWDAFKSEISFAFNFTMDTKPVRAKSSEGIVEGSRKSSLPRSLKSRSRFGSEPRSLAKKSKSSRSLNFDEVLHDSTSKSLLNFS